MRRQEEHRKLEELAKQEEMKRRQIDWEIAQRVGLNRIIYFAISAVFVDYHDY